MKIISIISTKGGTGKTTLAASIAGYLAACGKNVLAIDCDPQPTLSTYYDIVGDPPKIGIAELVMRSELTDDMISQTSIPNLSVIQNNDPENKLSSFIQGQVDGRLRLKLALSDSPLAQTFDYILVDSPGTVSPVQEMAAIAGDILLSPVPPETLSAREFIRGTSTLYERMLPLKRFGITLGNTHVIIWKQQRNNDSKALIQALYQQFENNAEGLPISVLNTLVPTLKAFAESATFGKPPHTLSVRVKKLIADILHEVTGETITLKAKIK